MRPVTRLVQLKLGAPCDHLFAEGDERGDEVLQPQHFGPPATDRQHIGRERALRRGIAPDLVQHDLGRRIALQLDHDAHTHAARFVADIADAFDPLVLGGLGQLLDEARFADLIGDGRQHDRATVATAGLDDMARAHHHRAAPGVIGVACAALAEDQRRGREIWPWNDLHQLVCGDCGIVHRRETGVDHLAQIVWRDVGGHADGDAARAIDQEIGEARREHRRLTAAAVIVIDEVDGILVEIIEQRVRHAGQTRFGIAHRGWRIGVHATEVALTVDQRQAHRPILGHTRQRIIDRAVAMRVIVTHHVADDLGRFTIGPPGDHPAFLGCKQYAAMDRL